MTKLERFGLEALAEHWRRHARQLEARSREPGTDPLDRSEMEGRAASFDVAAKELLEATENA